jgi:hypothetical protein
MAATGGARHSAEQEIARHPPDIGSAVAALWQGMAGRVGGRAWQSGKPWQGPVNERGEDIEFEAPPARTFCRVKPHRHTARQTVEMWMCLPVALSKPSWCSCSVYSGLSRSSSTIACIAATSSTWLADGKVRRPCLLCTLSVSMKRSQMACTHLAETDSGPMDKRSATLAKSCPSYQTPNEGRPRASARRQVLGKGFSHFREKRQREGGP